jgi:hypothetical protein
VQGLRQRGPDAAVFLLLISMLPLLAGAGLTKATFGHVNAG